MNTSILENIGLSNIEIKVFITILELGESKAGKIIEKSNLQSSSAYNAINSLINKGLLSYIRKGQIKYYKTVDPEAILDYIDLKKREYLKLLPELKSRQKKTNQNEVEFFKSYRGIKALISDLMKDSKKGDIYRSFSIENENEYERAMENVFTPTKLITKQKKLILRVIFPEKNRHPSKKSTIDEKKYLNFPMPQNTLILNDKVAIISWKDESSGILIKSEDIAKKYSDFFDALWKIAKP